MQFFARKTIENCGRIYVGVETDYNAFCSLSPGLDGSVTQNTSNGMNVNLYSGVRAITA